MYIIFSMVTEHHWAGVKIVMKKVGFGGTLRTCILQLSGLEKKEAEEREKKEGETHFKPSGRCCSKPR